MNKLQAFKEKKIRILKELKAEEEAITTQIAKEKAAAYKNYLREKGL